MHGKFTRVLASALAAALLMSGCAKKPAEPDTQSTSKSGALFSEPTEIQMVVGSHASWPYNENWLIWKYIEEATNAKLQIQAIPNENIITKVTLMMASPDTLPDLIHMIDKREVDRHAESGACISMTQNLDQLPHFQKFLDSLDSSARDELIAQRTSGDGEIYFTPVTGTETVSNLRSWMYRKDIFEKHNLKIPATTEELYQVAKQLKALYPESYPLCFRDGLTQLDVMGPQWQNDFCHGLYYDFQENKWKLGSCEPVMKEMVDYYLKLKDEGLVPPDYLTITAKSWEELVSTDRGFLMPEYIVRIDYFNAPNREVNPEYTWAAMAPPKGTGSKGAARITKLNYPVDGFMICNTKDQKRIANALRFVDWMYSDDALDLLNWGKPDETYAEKDGKKQFILTGNDNASVAYGIGTYGTYLRRIPASMESVYTEELTACAREAIQYVEEHVNPFNYLALNDDEAAVRDTYYDAIKDYNDEQLSRFLLGQRPMSEWDAFLSELEDMGLPLLLEAYTSAYNRLISQ